MGGMQGAVPASDMWEEEVALATHQQEEVPKNEGHDDYYGHSSNAALFKETKCFCLSSFIREKKLL